MPHLEAAIEAASEDGPEDRAFLFETYGGLLFALGRADEAVAALEKGLALRTGRAAEEAAFGLATVLRMLGRIEASDKLLASFERSAEARRAEAEALLAHEPAGPFEVVCRIELATAHAQLGDVDAAIDTLEAALERIEEDGAGDEPFAAYVLLRLGALKLYERRDVEVARDLLDEALGMVGAEHPLAPTLMLHLGHAELIEERPDDARALFAEAARRAGDEPSILRAAIEHGRGITEPDAAVAKRTLERAAKLAPDEALAASIRSNLERLV